jgi:hypothetical protein
MCNQSILSIGIKNHTPTLLRCTKTCRKQTVRIQTAAFSLCCGCHQNSVANIYMIGRYTKTERSMTINEYKKLTNEVGAPIGDNENSITAGSRGPVVMQDVWLMEKWPTLIAR